MKHWMQFMRESNASKLRWLLQPCKKYRKMDQNSSATNPFILIIRTHISQNISPERNPLSMDKNLRVQTQRNTDAATKAAELRTTVEII